jgi:hypothetical protein
MTNIFIPKFLLSSRKYWLNPGFGSATPIVTGVYLFSSCPSPLFRSYLKFLCPPDPLGRGTNQDPSIVKHKENP